VSPRKPTAIDRHVGHRLRLLRQINGVSLEKLAEMVDVAPQQIQKYEVGETRISASRIYEIAQIFGVPLGWFYHDLEGSQRGTRSQRAERRQGPAEGAHAAGAEPSPEDLLVAYYGRLEPEMQEKLVDIARTLSRPSLKQVK